MAVFSPKLIYDYIDQYVYGQEEAKKAVSNAMFLHVSRYYESMNTNITRKPTSIMLLGPSGCGKTEIVRRACEAVSELIQGNLCPLLEIDSSHLSAPGWQGKDFDEEIKKHYHRYGDNEATFNTSVVFLDEFDKLCIPAFSQGGTDHNKNTLYSMLKTLEGGSIQSSRRKIHTNKMLFIYAGAFSNLTHQRQADNKVMGFNAIEGGKPTSVIQELDRCGVPTQILGRISSFTELDKLSKKQLRYILTKVKSNALSQYQSTWKYLGYELKLSRYHIDKIVDTCYTNGTGARGLQAELHRVLENELFKMEI